MTADQEIRDVDEGGKQLHFGFYNRVQFGLMTEEELAAVLQVEPLTLSKWRREGHAPPYVSPGKTVFYRKVDVDEWLRSIVQFPGYHAAQAVAEAA